MVALKKILIVEDDKNLCKELGKLLQTSGFEAVALQDFKHAKEEILTCAPDLILLDINIPYTNGELLLKQLRQESDIPIIMVTSQTNEADEVLSMSYGADDYITKPYNPVILLLRINAIFKRMEHTSDIMTYHDLSIIPQKGIIKKANQEILLTKNEMIIFTHLLSKQGIIVSRDELMIDLWDNDEFINDNALTVNISRLRTKLKEIESNNVIETRKGLGYILL